MFNVYFFSQLVSEKGKHALDIYYIMVLKSNRHFYSRLFNKATNALLIKIVSYIGVDSRAIFFILLS
jgi:hypothetical protein